MPRGGTARSGMALILALAAVVLAGGLALYMQARAAARAQVEQTELLREQLRLAAAEAAREALWILASDEDLQTDHLAEEWAAPRENVQADGLETWALVEDAGRFFNWNNLSVSNRATRSSREILLDLLVFCSNFTSAVRVAALEDFVDADDAGAYEAGFYQASAPPFRPPNRELWAPAELLRVHDFSADLFRPRPPPHPDDLFGGDLAAATALVPMSLKAPIPVNVNTALPEVLKALTGLQQDDVVRTILHLRESKPFESLAMLIGANPELAAMLEGTVATASTCFRVRARADKAGLRCTVLAWVERDAQTGDIRILQWVEGEG